MIRSSRYYVLVLLVLAGCASAYQPNRETSQTVKRDDASVVQAIQFELEASAFRPQKFKISVLLPPGYEQRSTTRYPVLYFNDGQDAAAVGLAATLEQLYGQGAIQPVIVVGIEALADRMGTYGLSNRASARSVPGDSRFGPVGNRAQEYSDWVATTLVAYIDSHYRTQRTASGRTIMGWSLGALNAFNLAWQYPEVFGNAGLFSPSFWLASDRTDVRTAQASRLVPAIVHAGPQRRQSRFWVAVGTNEETDDRDGDGVIDAVDDALDVVHQLDAPGEPLDRAESTPPAAGDAVVFHLLPQGQHNQASWAQMLPLFLRWNYPKLRLGKKS